MSTLYEHVTVCVSEYVCVVYMCASVCVCECVCVCVSVRVYTVRACDGMCA